jgi:hypothetical protein
VAVVVAPEVMELGLPKAVAATAVMMAM